MPPFLWNVFFFFPADISRRIGGGTVEERLLQLVNEQVRGIGGCSGGRGMCGYDNAVSCLKGVQRSLGLKASICIHIIASLVSVSMYEWTTSFIWLSPSLRVRGVQGFAMVWRRKPSFREPLRVSHGFRLAREPGEHHR